MISSSYSLQKDLLGVGYTDGGSIPQIPQQAASYLRVSDP